LVFDSGWSVGKRPFSAQRVVKWESLKVLGGKVEIPKSAGRTYHARILKQTTNRH